MIGQDQNCITIVMATYNGAAHLAEQLQSIARQSHENWRLFVSDDGSTDATLDLLAAFGRDYPVQVVAGPRQGAAANFLSALLHPDLPRGTVALSDQDDIWLPGKLARGLRQLGLNSDLPSLYAAESMLADAHGRPLQPTQTGKAKACFAASLGQNLFGGHSILFNAATLDLIRAAGRPAGIAFHDWWIYQLVSGAGGHLVLDPAPMLLYRQHGKNVLGAAMRGRFRGRLNRVTSGQWGGEMRAHAEALAKVAHLLTPEAQRTLRAYLQAPTRGFARVGTFRRLGLRRSSKGGEALMLGAAFAGLL